MILISNDDGPSSPGLRALIKALSEVDEVTFFIPEGPRSGSSMSLTLHKPLRIREIEIAGVRGRVCSGSPADAMVLAHIILDKKPEVVATGINLGDNTSLQDIFSSGTVAGALQASLLGYPAIAFSKRIPDEYILYPWAESGDFDTPSRIAAKIVRFVLDRGLPPGVSLLNVNFPTNVSERTVSRITRASMIKYEHQVDKRLDPRGRDYYWLWGKRIQSYPEDSDTKAIYELNEISITPLSNDLSNVQLSSDASSWLKDIIERLS